MNYTVIYDGNCNLCVTFVQLLENLDRGERFQYISMQDQVALQPYGVTAEDCEMGMILIDPDRVERWQGSDAAEEIGRLFPFGKVVVETYRSLPGVKWGGDRVYEQVRDNRYLLFGKRNTPYQSMYPACASDACQKTFNKK